MPHFEQPPFCFFSLQAFPPRSRFFSLRAFPLRSLHQRSCLTLATLPPPPRPNWNAASCHPCSFSASWPFSAASLSPFSLQIASASHPSPFESSLSLSPLIVSSLYLSLLPSSSPSPSPWSSPSPSPCPSAPALPSASAHPLQFASWASPQTQKPLSLPPPPHLPHQLLPPHRLLRRIPCLTCCWNWSCKKRSDCHPSVLACLACQEVASPKAVGTYLDSSPGKAFQGTLGSQGTAHQAVAGHRC
mmetsp:Transcript_33272/g.75821  ORF Transcript_33272/g.75821 Transcript_33272/m.75821 type:complete len:245 (-) Transcript_33272:415-1149(-)